MPPTISRGRSQCPRRHSHRRVKAVIREITEREVRTLAAAPMPTGGHGPSAPPSTSASTPLACARCATSCRATPTPSSSTPSGTARSSIPTSPPRVAQAIKEWAIAHGATHFTHWFQPQTGLTAEKHDAFLSFDDGQPIGSVRRVAAHPERAGRVELPVGRTARDVGSARLHGVESGEPGVHRRVGGRQDAVHSVGLRRLQRRSARRDDAAAPQLRRALRRRRSSCSSCSATRASIASTRRSAPEQEYFLIDRAHFALRPDLVMAGRTLSARRRRAGSSSRTTTSAASRSACRRASPRSSTSSTSSACRSSRGTTRWRRASSRWRRASRRRTSRSTTTSS